MTAASVHSRNNGHPESLITDQLDIWSAAVKTKSAAGRGTSAKLELYGINKLRELILDLAVRGLLVPQDPNDEPAAVLLKKIAAEKARLVKEGKIKKQKKLPPIVEDEKPFPLLPIGWEWVRFGDAGETNIGLTYSPKDITDDGLPVLRSSNIQKGKIDLNDLVRVSTNKVKDNAYVKINDLLICARNGSRKLVGKTAMIKQLDEPMAFGAFMAIFRSQYNLYFEVFLNSPIFRRNLLGISTTTINQITQENLKSTVAPLPPLAEQHRIVAKVDELMAICDQLEKQQEASIGAHETLVQTLLDSLTATSERDGFQQAWARIAEHFDTLFTTEWSIDQLKQTILQLAVMGRLVPQDPSDEPASVLLKKIAAEKARLVKEGTIKKQKKLPPIEDEEKPFDLPEGWAWERLEALTELITKGSSPKWQGVSYTENPDDILFVTSENVGAFELRLDKEKYVERKFNEIEPRSILRKNDVLMNLVGASIGRTAIFNVDRLANINQAVCLIRMHSNNLSLKFLLLFFNSAICISYMYDKQVENARANLSMGNVAKFIIPMPPLAEQHRIVAKVDELMALCDSLTARIHTAQTVQLHLADAMAAQVVGQ